MSLAAYEKYLAALAKWRELRKKKCLKVEQILKPARPPPPVAPPGGGDAPTTAIAEGIEATLSSVGALAFGVVPAETTPDFSWVPTTDSDECCTTDLGWLAAWFGSGVAAPPPPMIDFGANPDSALGPEE